MKRSLSLLIFLFAFQLGLNAQQLTCRVDSILRFKYIIGTSFTEATSRSLNSYDAQNNLTFQIVRDWNAVTNYFVNDYRWLYQYNPNNQVGQELRQTWDEVNNSFENQFRTYHVYDSRANLLTETRSDFNAGA
jgi:hypothetical protein